MRFAVRPKHVRKPRRIDRNACEQARGAHLLERGWGTTESLPVFIGDLVQAHFVVPRREALQLLLRILLNDRIFG